MIRNRTIHEDLPPNVLLQVLGQGSFKVRV